MTERPQHGYEEGTRWFTVIVFLIGCCFSVSAQDWPSEIWHEGKTVLVEGDTLKGLLKYDLAQNNIQMTLNNRKAEAYSARKVLFFEIFDVTVKRYRQFYSLPYSETGAYKSQVFFELLEEGKLTLLVRESLEYRAVNSGYYGASYTRLVMIYKYFFLEEDGTIKEFQGNKNDLLDLMGKRAEDVEKYIKSNRLHFEEKYDLAKIVAYYNSFFGS